MNVPNNRKLRHIRDCVLIICGGVTEKKYFDKFKSRIGKIEVQPMLDADSPRNIVEFAIEKMLSGKYLKVWCVFDKDNFNCFDEAIKLAYDKGIGVAFSNQAFDLWFILHFIRVEGVMHRDKYKNEINKLLERKECNALDKPYEGIHGLLKTRLTTAIANAKIGHQKHKRDNGGKYSDWESCSTVYLLVEEILRLQ